MCRWGVGQGAGGRGALHTCQRGVDEFADPGAGAAALQVEAADVDAVLGQQGEDGGGAGGVGGDVAAAAADEQFAEAAPAGGVRHPDRDAERGGGEGGDALGLDARGVVGQDQAVGGGGERPGEQRDPGP